jgi:hypothetical protein
MAKGKKHTAEQIVNLLRQVWCQLDPTLPPTIPPSSVPYPRVSSEVVSVTSPKP